MKFDFLPAQSCASALLGILVRDDVWNPQSFDGVERPSEFPVPEGSWVLLLRDESESPAAYILFLPRGIGVYEQHTAIPEEHRDQWGEMIEAAHRAMFLETDATMLTTFCPDWLPHLVKVSSRFGAKKYWHKDYFATREGVRYGAQVMGLTVMDWAWRVHQEFSGAGEEWHASAFSDGTPSHEDDPCHDGFVGLSLAMSVKCPAKAQQVYNTWAATAGYWPLEILWAEGGNSLIDIGNAVILNKAGKFAAVLHRPCPPPPQS